MYAGRPPESTADRNLTSPLHNRLEHMYLALLRSEAAEELIRRGTPPMTEQDRSSIEEWAGADPFYIQLFAKQLLRIRKVGGDPEEALEEFRSASGPNLKVLWSALNPREQGALLRVCGIREAAATQLPEPLRRTGFDVSNPLCRSLEALLVRAYGKSSEALRFCEQVGVPRGTMRDSAAAQDILREALNWAAGAGRMTSLVRELRGDASRAAFRNELEGLLGGEPVSSGIARSLRRRGVLARDERPFGRVLPEWLRVRA